MTSFDTALSPAANVPAEVAAAMAELQSLQHLAAQHQAAGIAESTRRNYEADWAAYERWCLRLRVPALPVDPRLVALYITDKARAVKTDGSPAYKVSTLRRHVASLAHMNYTQGGGRALGEHPEIAAVLGGLQRQRKEPRTARQPLLLEDVKTLVRRMDHSTWPAGMIAARDTFAILTGFATAMRRSEVAPLTVKHIRLLPMAPEPGQPQQRYYLSIRIASSKTDQEGDGRTVAVPPGEHPITCVPCAWARWVRLLAVPSRAHRMRAVMSTPAPDEWEHVCGEPLLPLPPEHAAFPTLSKAGKVLDRSISGNALYERLKLRLTAAGYEGDYGFHSLRAGMVTQALLNGSSYRAIRKQTGHRTDSTVDIYDRDNTPLRGNAVNDLGL